MSKSYDFERSYHWSIDSVATGDALKNQRLKNEMTRSDVLDLLGMAGEYVSETALSYWENGTRNITLKHLYMLSRIYRVSMDQLVIGEDGFRAGAEEAVDPADPFYFVNSLQVA